jgi:hypothetical protein
MRHIAQLKWWSLFAAGLALNSLAMGQPLLPDLPATPPPAPTPVGGPKVVFETPVFDFGKAKTGEQVKHTFIFTNVGNATLIVSNVQPSCGCTTAGEWTRQVEPGKTGTIPMQFNTANFNGPVFKTVTVTTSDPSHNPVVLQIKGNIWRPIDVNPQFAILTIPSEGPATSAIVRVINNTEEPLTLGPLESNNPKLTATLVTNQPGKEYQVVISAVPPLTSGNFQGQITAKTSSTNMPVLTVTAWANVQPAILVMPQQIVLAASVLGETTPTITIQNNSTTQMQVSDVAVNIPDLLPQLRQIVPGKTFSVSITFPKGFTLPPNVPAELTFKTTHPHAPTIKVPITQLPRTTTVGIPGPAPTAH